MNRSPFPGMDPYLETSGFWPDVHSSLMTVFRDELTPKVAPNYIVELETQLVIDQVFPSNEEDYPKSRIPDVAIIDPNPIDPLSSGNITVAEANPAPMIVTLPLNTEIRLVSVKIRRRATQEIVTVIELLSPINKRPGKNRDTYLQKRLDYVEGGVKLVELDLLYRYPRMPFDTTVPDVPYLAIVSQRSKHCYAWPIRLSDRLPSLPIPLHLPDPPVALDIQTALDTIYERARYDLRLDYNRLPNLPLTEEEKIWIRKLLNLAER